MKLPNSYTYYKENKKKTINLRVFWMACISMFLIVTLQKLHIPSPMSLIRPVPSHVDVFDSIEPKLAERENTYKLSNSVTILPQAHAAAAYDNARSYVMVDFDSGQILAEKNPSDRVPIASLTKIMTAVVALDLADPSERFTASEVAANVEPTRMGVSPGERLTLNELLHGLLMFSANDAAQVIKEGMDQKYGSEVFIRAMNEKAALIGLKDTHFVNPQGYDDTQHYSSAEDLAILSHYALANYPLIKEIVSEDYTILPADVYHKEFKLYNWNGLLDVYPGVSGIKIGNTAAAQKTMVALADRGGKKILVVMLGAPGVLERDLWTSQLLDDGYQETLGLPPVNVTESELRAKYQTWVL